MESQAANQAALQGINAQIADLERQIAVLRGEISRIRQQHDRVVDARKEASSKRQEFNEVIAYERAKAEKARTSTKMRAAASYADSMGDLLRGRHFSQADGAYQGIDESFKRAISKKKEEIAHKEQLIQSHYNQIAQLRNRAHSLMTSQ